MSASAGTLLYLLASQRPRILMKQIYYCDYWYCGVPRTVLPRISKKHYDQASCDENCLVFWEFCPDWRHTDIYNAED